MSTECDHCGATFGIVGDDYDNEHRPDCLVLQVAAITARLEAADALNKTLIEGLRMYAFPEHWMSLAGDPDGDRVVWIARTHFDATGDGFSTAAQVLMSAIAPPATETP
jgi:hypothetical protein